jgi:hypothetical protein
MDNSKEGKRYELVIDVYIPPPVLFAESSVDYFTVEISNPTHYFKLLSSCLHQHVFGRRIRSRKRAVRLDVHQRRSPTAPSPVHSTSLYNVH